MSATVLTLIGTVAAQASIAEAAAAIRAALAEGGATVEAAEWLAPGAACDIGFAGLDPGAADAAARTALAAGFAGLPADLLVQPKTGRRKALLLADMESTIIENEMLDELADFLGLRAEVAEITRRAMNDEIDFVAALEARVALLAGMAEGVLATAASRIRVTPGAASLVATMRANGAFAALVSGGFRNFTTLVRRKLGFDFDIGNELMIADGRLTGTVGLPIVTRETKRATLEELAAQRGLALDAALTVGDGANDLPMLAAAGLGIAFRAKPAVAARARWRIDHCDLTALLYAQGYRAAEIIA